MAAAGEEAVGAVAADAEGNLLAGCLLQTGFSEYEGRGGGAAATASAGRLLRRIGRSVQSRIGKGCGADGAGSLECSPSLGPGSEVRDHGAGGSDRSGSVHIDGDFPLQVDAGKLVE